MNDFDYEIKYIGDNRRSFAIKNYLENNLLPDGEFPEAIISSIYFDTKTLKYLNEKNSSDHIKSKFRIRWYEDVNTFSPSPEAFLEFKHKINLKRFKRRKKIKNNFFKTPLKDPLFTTYFEDFRLFEGKLLEPIYPSYIVRYHRKRFIDPVTKLRICIDSNIHVGGLNQSLLGNQIHKKYLNNCVVETKGLSRDLPRQLRFLESYGLKKNAFSKYERCYYELIKGSE